MFLLDVEAIFANASKFEMKLFAMKLVIIDQSMLLVGIDSKCKIR